MKDGEKTVVIDKDLTKSIVRTAILELDLVMTKAMSEIKTNQVTLSSDLESFKRETASNFDSLKREIPFIVDAKVKACEKKQKNDKKWNIRTLLIILGVVLSNGLAAYAAFGG